MSVVTYCARRNRPVKFPGSPEIEPRIAVAHLALPRYPEYIEKEVMTQQLTDQMLIAKAREVLKRGYLAKIDNSDVEQYFRGYALAGNAACMTYCGALCGERGEIEQATQWFQDAAIAGDPYAMMFLGSIANLRGDSKTAENWFLKAGNLNEPKAFQRLAQLYGQRGDEANYNYWLEKFDAWGNNAVANNEPLQMLDLTQVRDWLEAAEQRQTQPKSTLDRLIERFEQDATPLIPPQYTDPNTQYNIGNMYRIGGEVPKNIPLALRWYVLAADNGHPSAAFNYASTCEYTLTGQLPDEFPRDAVDLSNEQLLALIVAGYRQAIELGHPRAAERLSAFQQAINSGQ